MEARKQRGRDNKIRGSGLTVSEQVVHVIRERQEKMMESMEEDKKLGRGKKRETELGKDEHMKGRK